MISSHANLQISIRTKQFDLELSLGNTFLCCIFLLVRISVLSNDKLNKKVRRTILSVGLNNKATFLFFSFVYIAYNRILLNSEYFVVVPFLVLLSFVFVFTAYN